MKISCPKCQSPLSLRSHRSGKPFPCPSCGTDLKITSPSLPVLFWFLPPFIDLLFLAMASAGTRNRTVVTLLHEQQSSPLPTPARIDLKNIAKSAEAGDADAQFYLGGMYFTGNGTQRNYEEAYFWHSLAANSGESKEELVALRRYLSAEKVAAIEKRVADWKPTPAPAAEEKKKTENTSRAEGEIKEGFRLFNRGWVLVLQPEWTGTIPRNGTIEGAQGKASYIGPDFLRHVGGNESIGVTIPEESKEMFAPGQKVRLYKPPEDK